MPVIVYKTMTIELFYAQGRRIVCESCRKPFCYITGNVQSAQTTGIPVVSSDDGMRHTALNKAIGGLRGSAKKDKVGEAMCPHCKCYQGWMVTNSHFSNLGCGFIGGLIVLLILGAVLNFFFEFTDNWLVLLAIFAGVGAILGLGLGKLAAISVGPHRDEDDERAMSDEDFAQFVHKCHEQDADPFLAWWIMLGNEPGAKQAVVTLGMEDKTGQSIFPREMSTDHILANLR